MLHSISDATNDIRVIQRFISQGVWDDEAALTRHIQEVDQDLGGAVGVRITESVRAKRHCSDRLGKVANC
jgi:hypothetical protein